MSAARADREAEEVPTHRSLRIAAIAAPALLFLYGVLRLIDGLDGSHGRGLAWDVGHLLFLGSFAFFGVLLVALRRSVGPRRRAGRLVADLALAPGLFGAGCFAWVIVGDLLPSFDDAVPLPEVLRMAGPLAFQLGLITLLVLLVRSPRRLPVLSPVLTLAGFLLLGFDLDLLPVGAALVLAGLAPLALRPTHVRGARQIPQVGADQ